ncbi:MAG: hypothetical protein ACLSUM_00785 [Dysosmobacter welbionis]
MWPITPRFRSTTLTRPHKTYEATDLADVILFEAEAKATSANYMLVLSANAIGKDPLELNVVFEDGTVQAIGWTTTAATTGTTRPAT